MKTFRIEFYWNYDVAYEKSVKYTVTGRSLKAALSKASALFKKDTFRQRIKVGKILFFVL